MFAIRSSQQFTLGYKNYPNNKHPIATASQELRKKIQHYSFLLSDKIGKGYSSTVYKGLNEMTGEQVAIKVIDLHSLRDQTSKIMLSTEIECFKQVKHKHLLRFENSYYTVNNCYIITQYCSKGDLARFIKERRILPEQEASKLFYQIYLGYLHFHLAGYIHRDLKPANIFISNQDQLKIADFGFCKKPTLVERENYNVGTPVYMPKESLAANIYNQKTDVWSLGVTLYEMAFGEVPFKGKTQLELRAQIDKGILQFPSTVPITNDLKNFISACLLNDSFRRLSIRDMHKHPWMKRVIQKMSGKEQLKRSIIPQIYDEFMCHTTYEKNQRENEEDTVATKKKETEPKEMRISSPNEIIAHHKSKEYLSNLGNQNRRSICSMQKLKIFHPKKASQIIQTQRQLPNRSNSMSNQFAKVKKLQILRQNNFTQNANKQNIPQNGISISTQPSVMSTKPTLLMQKKAKRSKSQMNGGIQKVVSLINYFRLLYKIYQKIAVTIKQVTDANIKSEMNHFLSKMSMQLNSNFNLHLICVSTKRNVFGFKPNFWDQFINSPRWQMYCYVIGQYQTKYRLQLAESYAGSQKIQDGKQWKDYFILLYQRTKPILQFGVATIRQQYLCSQLLYFLHHFVNIYMIIRENDWEDYSEIYMDSRQITQDHFRISFSNYEIINNQLKQKYEEMKCK